MSENEVIRFRVGDIVDMSGVPFRVEQIRRTRLVMSPMAAYRQAGNMVMEVEREDAKAADDRLWEVAQRRFEDMQAVSGTLRDALAFYAEEEVYDNGLVVEDRGDKARAALYPRGISD